MYDLLEMMAPLFLCDDHQHQANYLANLWKGIFTQAFGSGALNLSMQAGVVPPEGHSSASTLAAPSVTAVCVVSLPPPPVTTSLARQSTNTHTSSVVPATRNSTGSLTVPAPDWPAGMVKPRPLEGECGICFLSFVGEEAKQARWTDKVPSDRSSAPGNTGNTHTGEPDRTEDDEEDEEDSEEPEDEWDFEYELFPLKGDYDVNLLVWCRGHCGTNFHRRCMDRWIGTFRGDSEPTCPICRREWVEWDE